MLSHLTWAWRSLNIWDIWAIRWLLIEKLREWVDPSKLGVYLLEAIGTGNTFTNKALRVLSWHLPIWSLSIGNEEEDTTQSRIQEIIESKKRSPDPSVLYTILARTNFEWVKMQWYMREWSAQALVNLNNYIYSATQDWISLWKNARKYVLLRDCISSQLQHKEWYTVSADSPKNFFWEVHTNPDKSEVPSQHKIYFLSLRKN